MFSTLIAMGRLAGWSRRLVNLCVAGAAAVVACLIALSPSAAWSAAGTDGGPTASSIVAPSVAGTVDGATIDPSLARAGGQLLTTGTLSPAAISVRPRDGFAIGALDSPVTVTPDAVSADAGNASIVNADSVVYSNTQVATDTVVRPTADGVESFLVLQDASAPKVFSWTVGLEPNQRLVNVDAQTVAIERPRIDPATQVSPGDLTSAPTTTGDIEDVADVNAQLSVERGALTAAQAKVAEDGRQLAGVIAAPWATDANGGRVPLTLTAVGNRVTLTIAPIDITAGYPLIVDPQFFGFTITTELAKYCAGHVPSCLTGLGLAAAAQDSMVRHYPHAHETGRGDAFRHCFWNAMMEHRLGGATATAIATRNESESSGFAHSMDLHNNREGRVFWHIFKSERAAGNSCLADAQPGRGLYLTFRNVE